MPGFDRPRRRMRSFVAGLTAALLATTGAVVAGAIDPQPAAAAYPESVNPFAIAGGFTVYAREDALLQNQETEGSIAVGGTATVQGSSGQYTIIHVSAGTGNYDLPTVDGDPTRFLVGEYSTASTGILAITSAGTTDPALWGDLKMVQRDGGWQAFTRADWLRLNQNPSNVDQTPLIDATHQQYPADAAPPSGAAGDGSIYTANTSATAVADYVEANRDASWEEASSCFDDIADPTTGVGYHVGVAEDAGDRVVLEELSPDQPNIVDYADIAGASLIQFSPGPTPGVSNPLVIRVPAGTTEVIGARADPQGVHSPYIVWDLSQLTGDVTVTAGQARIDGSIYAPNASVTVNAAPLDGQVIGQNVIIQGGEVHSFLFSGEISCDDASGTFVVRKALSGGIQPGDLPEGATFTVNYRAVDPDGNVTVGSLEVPADGTPVPAGERFPAGTEITFEEITPETIPGWAWGDVEIDPNPLIVGTGTAQVVVTNTATRVTGTFSVSKSIDDPSGEPPVLDGSVPVTWIARYGGEQIGTGTMNVPFTGTPVVPVDGNGAPIAFPVGTRIILTENLDGIDPPPGYDWSGIGWNPGRTFVITGAGTTVEVELTNLVTPTDDGRTITIVKSATGSAADPRFGYEVTYNTNPAPERATLPLPVGEPQLIEDLETGAETLELAELAPTFEGDTVANVDDWVPPVFNVTVDGVTTPYQPDGFGDVVDIPLPPDSAADIEVEVTNALKEGTFTISKEFDGVPPDQVPPGLEFTVAWTAYFPTTEPEDVIQEGVLRVPGNGAPVGPVDDAGEPLLFPYGTVVTYEEQVTPTIRHLSWLGAAFDLEQLTIGVDDQAVVHATLTNDASLIEGTFLVQKNMDGIDPDDLLVDSFTIDYVAHLPSRDVLVGRFELPADGTPAGPVDGQGAPISFPIGTIVNLLEEEPDASALPPGYEWGETTWSPASFVEIGPGETPPVLEVTNSVVAMTRWAVTKVVAGDGGSSVPASTTFPADWWLDGVAQPRIELEPNVTITSPYFPVGTIIQAREADLPSIPGVDWGSPVWTVDGEALVPDEDGKVTLPMSEVRTPQTAELTLTNTASTRPLPATGGGGLSPLVPLGAVGLIALGVLLAARRARRV
ncbi:choice-of-anchor A domain-containing protein [Microbacterium trichothecenolyticum]|uniref:collagen-binding domain-containing protein n=1 Tax=Microbacterium trichothecenolyticum TaxID=69370 RepID=UPI002856ADAF|nr:collagen-binding domain-containing protein [Microbacterium trichothecenolyticum]MDR7110338.1 choice-of-anchor A domain-containing protein [Microbacterium trichothecenolyticum]